MQAAADLTSNEFRHDPYTTYNRLREKAPVCRVRIGRSKFAWLVTRYADVLAAVKDTRFTKDQQSLPAAKQPWVPAVLRPLAKNMLDSDPPDHTRLRALVQKAFTPLMIEALRKRIEELTDQLIDGALRKKEFDLITEYALPLPTTIIAELVGVPAEDRHRFHRWSAKVVSLSPTAGPEMLFSIPAALAFLKYIQQQIRTRRTAPGLDLLSALIEAEETGDRLSDDELVAMIFLLLIARHETTVNLIVMGLSPCWKIRSNFRYFSRNPTCSSRR